VERRDRRLHLVLPGLRGTNRPIEDGLPLVDLGAIPTCPVLVLEQHEVTIRCRARVASRVVEQHQGEQAEGLGLVRHELDEHASQPDRLAGQLAPHERLPRGRAVALVEDEVQDAEHGVEPLRQDARRRDPVRDAGVTDLPLGPDEPLGERRLWHEEGACDGRRLEPAERAQRQGDPGLRRECRMAAGEDEPQSVIDAVRCGHLILLGPARRRVDLRLPAELRGLVGEPPVAADPVDRPIASRGRDPRPRVPRHALCRPHFERPGEGVLNGLLGEIEVTQHPDEGRDRPPRFLAEQAVDQRVSGVRRQTGRAGADAVMRSAAR
jgi:hypothetical protein